MCVKKETKYLKPDLYILLMCSCFFISKNIFKNCLDNTNDKNYKY